jgi:anti-repressor protein
MNELRTFKNDEFGEVRTLVVNDEAWFVGKDVARILGYKKPENAIAAHVDDEDKTTTLIQGTGSNYKSNAVVINESGLYSLILSSKLPNAKKFKHWVTSDVLPSIRKTGAYQKPLSRDQLIAQALIEAQAVIEEKDNRIKEMRPKEIFSDAVATSKTSILIGELAKLLKQNGIEIGQKRLFAWMRNNGYLMKSGSSKNMPTQRAMQLGLFEIKEGSYINGNGASITTKTTKVTGKGQIYFINKFLGDGNE